MQRIITLARRFVVLRIIFFEIFKIFSFIQKLYLVNIKHKPKSSNLFADDMLPIGRVRLAILKGLGIPDNELRSKPLIAIANSFCEINPGHKHLKQLAEAVKAGILSAGGLPFEFNVPAPCDGLANGNDGMHYILPQRDAIADIIEMYIRSQWFDGMVTISSCDKINPGMLMAAARLDIPTICLPGGPNIMNIRFKPGCNSLDHKDYEDITRKIDTATSATCGSCELLTTANTMQILTEAMGMALPYSACAPAFSSQKFEFAYEAGRRIVSMIKEEITPDKIMTRESFENAVMVCLAVGGSTNTALHIPAIAYQLNLDIDINIFNKFNKQIPTLCSIAPNGPHGVFDLFCAGGVPAVMKRLESDLHLDCLTVTGQMLRDIVKSATVENPEVIKSKESPYITEGGIVALFGNLATEGCIVKQSAIKPSMMKFKGAAKVFESERDALVALTSNKIKEGDVIVIRNEGPKGSPGMPEMLSETTLISILGLERVALITDGRFSGATAGPCIGHISPEAYDAGAIAAIVDGDIISIDIPERKIELEISEEELKKRLRELKKVERKIESRALHIYRRLVSSASKGAVLTIRD